MLPAATPASQRRSGRGPASGPAIITLGIAALATVALGRPFLQPAAEHAANLNPERHTELAARLAAPDRRRALGKLTAIIGLTLAIDGVSQIVLALTVPTGDFVADSTAVRILVLGIGDFVADSTAVRILVLGIGLIVTVRYVRYQRARRERAPMSRRN